MVRITPKGGCKVLGICMTERKDPPAHMPESTRACYLCDRESEYISKIGTTTLQAKTVGLALQSLQVTTLAQFDLNLSLVANSASSSQAMR